MSEIPAFYSTLKAEFGKLSSDKAIQDYIKSGDVEKLITKTFDTVKPELLDLVVKGSLGQYYHMNNKKLENITSNDIYDVLIAYQRGLEQIAKGFRPQGYAQKDEGKVRLIPDLMDTFRKESAKLTTDQEFTKFFKTEVSNKVMEMFKVDKATAELVEDEIKEIGLKINDLKKADAEDILKAVEAALTNIADGQRKDPRLAG